MTSQDHRQVSLVHRRSEKDVLCYCLAEICKYVPEKALSGWLHVLISIIDAFNMLNVLLLLPVFLDPNFDHDFCSSVCLPRIFTLAFNNSHLQNDRVEMKHCVLHGRIRRLYPLTIGHLFFAQQKPSLSSLS